MDPHRRQGRRPRPLPRPRAGARPRRRGAPRGAPPALLLARPRGPADPRDLALAPPWPDLAIAAGRRAVPVLRALRRRAGAATFTVFLRDPRTGPGAADLIWVPEHDRLRGRNVLVTLAGPHPVSAARLAAARAAPDPRLRALPAPARRSWSAATTGAGGSARRPPRPSCRAWSASPARRA
uniref:ELM1/GtrOC1 family putative glycosyltransferase n=1 Tax=Methylobacterium sp. CB376 TaxID=3138063 RepID=UPI003133B082